MTNDHMRAAQPFGRTRWWVGGAAVALALTSVAGCKVQDASATTAHSDSQQQSYTHQIDGITLNLDSGDVTLNPGPAGQVSLQRSLKWDNTKPTVTERWNGNTLAITGHCATGEHNCATGYQITLPAGVTVTVKTDAGDITTHGIHGAQDLRSDAGDLNVDGGTGRLTLNTNGGRITGTGLSAAQVNAGTDAGDISLTLSTVPDSVTVKSNAGNIDLQVPRAGTGADGYSVQASTDAGTKRVLVDTSAAGRHRIQATSDSGDVQVRYAS